MILGFKSLASVDTPVASPPPPTGITASAGNHAQGVAYAAKCYGVKAVIVMPTTTPLIKALSAH